MKYIVDPSPQGYWTVEQVRASKEAHAVVATLQEAVDLACDGDKIIIGPGTHDESISLHPLLGKRVEIRGEP